MRGTIFVLVVCPPTKALISTYQHISSVEQLYASRSLMRTLQPGRSSLPTRNPCMKCMCQPSASYRHHSVQSEYDITSPMTHTPSQSDPHYLWGRFYLCVPKLILRQFDGHP